MNRIDSEEALVAAAQRGDEGAFGELLTKYERMVYHAVRQKVKNDEDAADLTQEVFLKVWRHLPNYRGECRFSTWVWRISMNTCLDFLRSAARRPHEVDMTQTDDDGDERVSEPADESTAASPEKRVERNETAALVRAAIDSLPDEQREVVMLRDIEGFSYDEIARMLSLELGTVKSRLNRARAALREIMRESKNFAGILPGE